MKIFMKKSINVNKADHLKVTNKLKSLEQYQQTPQNLQLCDFIIEQCYSFNKNLENELDQQFYLLAQVGILYGQLTDKIKQISQLASRQKWINIVQIIEKDFKLEKLEKKENIEEYQQELQLKKQQQSQEIDINQQQILSKVIKLNDEIYQSQKDIVNKHYQNLNELLKDQHTQFENSIKQNQQYLYHYKIQELQDNKETYENDYQTLLTSQEESLHDKLNSQLKQAQIILKDSIDNTLKDEKSFNINQFKGQTQAFFTIKFPIMNRHINGMLLSGCNNIIVNQNRSSFYTIIKYKPLKYHETIEKGSDVNKKIKIQKRFSLKSQQQVYNYPVSKKLNIMITGTTNLVLLNIKTGKIIKQINNLPSIEKGVQLMFGNKLILAGQRKVYLLDYYKDNDITNCENYQLQYSISQIIKISENQCFISFKTNQCAILEINKQTFKIQVNILQNLIIDKGFSQKIAQISKNFIAIASKNCISVIDLENQNVVQQYPSESYNFRIIQDIVPLNTKIFATSTLENIQLWKLGQEKPLHTINIYNHGNASRSVILQKFKNNKLFIANKNQIQVIM